MKHMNSIFWAVLHIPSNQITYMISANKRWGLAVFKTKEEAQEFIISLELPDYKVKKIKILTV